MRIRHMEANPTVSLTSLERATQCADASLSGPEHRVMCLTHCLQALNQNLLLKYNKINTERLKKVFKAHFVYANSLWICTLKICTLIY